MNERIKEIEKQCWQSTETDPYALFDVKKFAELIVVECGEFCGQVDRDAMFKHFGVEE